jgi:hypothetical protein
VNDTAQGVVIIKLMEVFGQIRFTGSNVENTTNQWHYAAVYEGASTAGDSPRSCSAMLWRKQE